MSRILIITTSLRAKSNSDFLAEQVADGAKAAEHQAGMRNSMKHSGKWKTRKRLSD